jgi:hypothetical protein
MITAPEQKQQQRQTAQDMGNEADTMTGAGESNTQLEQLTITFT